MDSSVSNVVFKTESQHTTKNEEPKLAIINEDKIIKINRNEFIKEMKSNISSIPQDEISNHAQKTYCVCKGNCITAKCICQRSNLKCGVECHNNMININCKNN